MPDTLKPYTYLQDINLALAQVPQDSILSRSLYQAADCKVILFGFAPGQMLSEHTAARPAVIHILEGEVDLTLGADHFQAGPGSWAHLEPNVQHSLLAKTPTVMLLTLIGGEG
jgi:quercetin dioxygenase-like cupin family protein